MSTEKPSSSVKESRRTSKPLMEKKRRARINECLTQLKTLVLEAMKKDSSRHSKLEKADILEMTVRHLRNLHRQYVAVAIAADPNVVNKYKAGYSECTSEVIRFLSSAEGIESTARSTILNHLNTCLKNVNSTNGAPATATATCSSASAGTSNMPVQHMQVQIPTFATIPIGPIDSAVQLAPVTSSASSNNEVNNNVNALPNNMLFSQNVQQFANMYNGLRFLPGTGEIALVLPNQGHLSSQIPVIPVYANTVASPTYTAGSKSTASALSTAESSKSTDAKSIKTEVNLANEKTPSRDSPAENNLSATKPLSLAVASTSESVTSAMSSARIETTSSSGGSLVSFKMERQEKRKTVTNSIQADAAAPVLGAQRVCKMEDRDIAPQPEPQNDMARSMWRPW